MPRKFRFLLLAFVTVASCMAFGPQEAAAQRRPFFHSPFYSGSFYRPYYFGLYGQYPYPPYGYRFAYDRTGSARIQVTPREAEVFVDGYFVGVVDDFDGYLQRLNVEAGEHELQFYLEGYRTIRQKVLFTPGTTLKITQAMEPLAPGEPNEPRPVPDETSRVQNAPGRRESRQYGRESRSGFGTLSLGVQPGDATVLIDGEEWDRPEGESRFFVDLAAGPHRLEVRKDGFKTYTRTIEVRRGQTVTLNVSLTGGGDAGSVVTMAEESRTPPRHPARSRPTPFLRVAR